MKWKLYSKDLAFFRNHRRTELSQFVVKHWTSEEDLYEREDLPKTASPEAVTDYCALTAERVFLRTKVLANVEKIDRGYLTDAKVLSARPFGEGTPSLRDLLHERVRVAMAYVPLAGSEGPLLARLYCVAGIDEEYQIPFESPKPLGAQKFAWFLGGVDLSVKPVGSSWFLAASVLMACMKAGCPGKVRDSLARDFIITGIVNERRRTERLPALKEKLPLAAEYEYEQMTWIVPYGNLSEVEGLKAVTVKSVDDAYERVLNGMDKPTRMLCDLVENGVQPSNVETIVDLLRLDADANCPNEKGWCVRQMVMSNINRKIVELIRTDGLKDKPVIEIQNAIREKLAPEWDVEKASSYYGNDPLLFFLTAKAKDDEIMAALVKKFNIDAVDRDGETALDFARQAKDEETEQFLIRWGAKKRGIYDINSKRVRAYIRDLAGEMKKDGLFMLDALVAGLNPFQEAIFGKMDDAGELLVVAKRLCWDNDLELNSPAPDPWNSRPEVIVLYERTTIFLEAILARHLGLVTACLNYAPDKLPDIYVKVDCDTDREIMSYISLARRFSSPAIIKAISEHIDKTC